MELARKFNSIKEDASRLAFNIYEPEAKQKVAYHIHEAERYLREGNFYMAGGKYASAAQLLTYDDKELGRAREYALKSAKCYEELKEANEKFGRRGRRGRALNGQPRHPADVEKLIDMSKDLAASIQQERALRRSERRKSLDSHISAALFIILGLAGLFFLSPNLTGNVIANLAVSTSNVLGIVLFFVAAVGLFFSLRK